MKFKKHRHRWAKPHLMSTVGWVKACRAKGCPTRMKAVQPKGTVLYRERKGT